MSRCKKSDLVSVNLNDITFSIGKDKCSQLSKEHINTIIRYDVQNKINGTRIISNQMSHNNLYHIYDYDGRLVG
jgi:hypothetical protein